MGVRTDPWHCLCHEMIGSGRPRVVQERVTFVPSKKLALLGGDVMRVGAIGKENKHKNNVY